MVSCNYERLNWFLSVVKYICFFKFFGALCSTSLKFSHFNAIVLSQDDKDDGTFQGESGGPFDNEINVEISRPDPDRRDVVGCFQRIFLKQMTSLLT